MYFIIQLRSSLYKVLSQNSQNFVLCSFFCALLTILKHLDAANIPSFIHPLKFIFKYLRLCLMEYCCWFFVFWKCFLSYILSLLFVSSTYFILFFLFPHSNFVIILLSVFPFFLILWLFYDFFLFAIIQRLSL